MDFPGKGQSLLRIVLLGLPHPIHHLIVRAPLGDLLARELSLDLSY